MGFGFFGKILWVDLTKDNLRDEDLSEKSNELPDKIIGNPPAQKGPFKGKTVEYKNLYRNYCIKMGWNPENGYPLKETLEKLNLEFVIKDLY